MLTDNEIAQLSPEVIQMLDEDLPGWRTMTVDAVMASLSERKTSLFRQADATLDTLNSLDRHKP